MSRVDTPQLMRRGAHGLLQGPSVVVIGFLVLTGCSVLTVLLGARVLTSEEYTVYAAFTGLVGILLAGPASSLEQESTLTAPSCSPRTLLQAMLLRVACAWALVVTLCLFPLGGWQQRLLGEEAVLGLTLLALGVPLVLVLGVVRGLAVAQKRFRLVAAAHLAAGLAMLGVPLLAHLLGLGFLRALLVGTVTAWLPALGIILALGSPTKSAAPRQSSSPPRHASAWMVIANLLVFANLLAAAPLLRWHVVSIGEMVAADAQLLVSMSRLTSGLMLGLLPLTVSILAGAGGQRPPLRLLGGATGLGLGAVAGVVALSEPLLPLLTGRELSLPLHTLVLATLPVVALCPAIVLMGAAIVRQRYTVMAGAWGAGLGILGLTALLDPGGISVVLWGILVAAVAPLLILSCALAAPSRLRGRV